MVNIGDVQHRPTVTFDKLRSRKRDKKYMDNPLQTQRNKCHTVDSKKCLSCGCTENMGTRKYCSVACRKNLRHQLNIRTGLLKALNTRYATFYFTEALLIMDVLP